MVQKSIERLIQRLYNFFLLQGFAIFFVWSRYIAFMFDI